MDVRRGDNPPRYAANGRAPRPRGVPADQSLRKFPLAVAATRRSRTATCRRRRPVANGLPTASQEAHSMSSCGSRTLQRSGIVLRNQNLQGKHNCHLAGVSPSARPQTMMPPRNNRRESSRLGLTEVNTEQFFGTNFRTCSRLGEPCSRQEGAHHRRRPARPRIAVVKRHTRTQEKWVRALLDLAFACRPIFLLQRALADGLASLGYAPFQAA